MSSLNKKVKLIQKQLSESVCALLYFSSNFFLLQFENETSADKIQAKKHVTEKVQNVLFKNNLVCCKTV